MSCGGAKERKGALHRRRIHASDSRRPSTPPEPRRSRPLALAGGGSVADSPCVSSGPGVAPTGVARPPDRRQRLVVAVRSFRRGQATRSYFYKCAFAHIVFIKSRNSQKGANSVGWRSGSQKDKPRQQSEKNRDSMQ